MAAILKWPWIYIQWPFTSSHGFLSVCRCINCDFNLWKGYKIKVAHVAASNENSRGFLTDFPWHYNLKITVIDHNHISWPRKRYKRWVTYITSTYKWSLYFQITWNRGHLENYAIEKKDHRWKILKLPKISYRDVI